MAKSKDNTGLYIGLALLGVSLAFMMNKGKQDTDTTAPQNEGNPNTNTGTSSGTSSNNNTTTSTPRLNWNIILQRGSRGEEVKKLQAWLLVAQDGIFGPITENALYWQTGLYRGTLSQVQRTFAQRGKIVG
jgi:hypothetical protein